MSDQQQQRDIYVTCDIFVTIFRRLDATFFRTLLPCPLVNNLAREARPHEPLHFFIVKNKNLLLHFFYFPPPPPSHCPSVVGCGHSTKYPSLVGCGHLYKTPLYCFLRAQKKNSHCFIFSYIFKALRSNFQTFLHDFQRFS